MDVAYKDGYFIRAFYPDGTPLGSKDSEDCKIDLIAQTWAAIALKDYPDCKEAIQSALNMAEKYLVDRVNNVIKLLYPPFDNPVHDPGYIKAYVPGVRENGGQYTHAAIWLAKAYFEIGEREKGLDILKIICPIYHSDTKQKADIYKVEPYVVAADVYATKEHIGRGGWTWYTGSAGWFYRVGIEEILGIYKHGKKLTLKPKIPIAWEEYKVTYNYMDTKYIIEVYKSNKEGNYKKLYNILSIIKFL
jgi:cyclic beta-1,2-glucan synthetase